MIPMILLENNAGTHQSGLCGREGGRGTMMFPWWEDVPNGTALFTAWPGREQHGEGVGGTSRGGINCRIIRLNNFFNPALGAGAFLYQIQMNASNSNLRLCHVTEKYRNSHWFEILFLKSFCFLFLYKKTHRAPSRQSSKKSIDYWSWI